MSPGFSSTPPNTPHPLPHETIDAAMTRAFALAAQGPAWGPNPRVGCVMLDASGTLAGEGWHRGAGQPHAEIEALADAARRSHDVRGGTAVVTLEPCAHHGKTGPCCQALLDAQVAHVAFAASEVNPQATGGAAWLQAHAITITGDLNPQANHALNPYWYHSVTTGRPWVTAKLAITADGRIAAADGSSRWITSPQARAHAHQVRATADAIVVGTGTVVTDNPALTARQSPTGSLTQHQPLRVVMGYRDIPRDCALHGPGGTLVQVTSHHPHEVLDVLAARDVRRAIIEGGQSVTTAFLAHNLVDELMIYLTPMILGEGRTCVAHLGLTSLDQAKRFCPQEVELLGGSVYIRATTHTTLAEPPLHSRRKTPEGTH